jgi:hypothetical protein
MPGSGSWTTSLWSCLGAPENLPGSKNVFRYRKLRRAEVRELWSAGTDCLCLLMAARASYLGGCYLRSMMSISGNASNFRTRFGSPDMADTSSTQKLVCFDIQLSNWRVVELQSWCWTKSVRSLVSPSSPADLCWSDPQASSRSHLRQQLYSDAITSNRCHP